ncbi:MAG: macro domain-containing protein [Alphaproteobacteria bacterium]|nr:macro domain-containing protein [Alphaproteobacteria bacterium]
MSIYKFKIKSADASIVLGNITKQIVDAYVVPHFDNEVSWGGVGASVSRAGAAKGMEEYEEKYCNGNLKFGDVILTNSYGGNSKYLLNATTVASGEDKEPRTVYEATSNAIKVAEANKLISVAFPALGTGIIGDLTPEQSALVMLGASHNALQTLKDIRFIIYGDEYAYNEFVKIAKSEKDVLKISETIKHMVGKAGFSQARWLSEFVQGRVFG